MRTLIALLALVPTIAHAQEMVAAPPNEAEQAIARLPRVSGCLDAGQGIIYGLVEGSRVDHCADGATAVSLPARVAKDLILDGRIIDLGDLGRDFPLPELDPNLIPPRCEDGEAPVATGAGWTCAPVCGGAPARTSRVWLMPSWTARYPGLDDRWVTRYAPEIHFVNPGEGVVDVACYFFDSGGSMLLDSASLADWGGALPAPARREGSGWALLVASGPIWPSASQTVDPRYEASQARYDVPLHAIDCSDPEGQEFACQFTGAR